MKYHQVSVVYDTHSCAQACEDRANVYVCVSYSVTEHLCARASVYVCVPYSLTKHLCARASVYVCATICLVTKRRFVYALYLITFNAEFKCSNAAIRPCLLSSMYTCIYVYMCVCMSTRSNVGMKTCKMYECKCAQVYMREKESDWAYTHAHTRELFFVYS